MVIYQEIKVALVSILPKYTFRVVKGHKVTYVVSITLAMKNGLRMRVDRRD